MTGTDELVLTEEQALAFRARRHNLLGPGAASPEEAARAVVGIQAQVVAPAHWSLATRCASCPSAADLTEVLATSTTLVRTWGQRDTVHIYDAAAHWAAIVTGLGSWPIGARGGRQPDLASLDAAEARVQALGRPVTRSDLFDLVPEDFLAYMAERVGPGTPALRAAAGRFVWNLSRRGVLSAHTVIGGEQSYVPRRVRYPGLRWVEPSGQQAGTTLIRDYLAANAPATVQDIAHFLGTRVSQARDLLAPLEGELVSVACGGRPGLLALERDADELDRDTPRSWPPRLLPRFDTMLMAHKDKSWTVPDETQRPSIWARAAQVHATLLHRGRLVATWRHKALKRSVKIDIRPLSGWQRGLERALAGEAHAFAAHLGVADAVVRLV